MKRNCSRFVAALLCGVVVLTLAGSALSQDFVYRKKPLRIKVKGAIPASALPSDAGAPSCGTLPSGLPLICYPPSYIRAAYNYPSVSSGLIGTGQTIVIVDAFGSPTIITISRSLISNLGLPRRLRSRWCAHRAARLSILVRTILTTNQAGPSKLRLTWSTHTPWRRERTSCW